VAGSGKSKLLHHAHLIPEFPALDHFPLSDAVQNHPADPHRTTGSGNRPEGATVRTFRGPPRRYLFARYNLILNSKVQIRKRGEQARRHLLESVEAEVMVRTAIDAYDAITRKDPISHIDVAAIETVNSNAFGTR
jgi:hypothetical protein